MHLRSCTSRITNTLMMMMMMMTDRQNHTQTESQTTEADQRYTQATTVGVSNK